MNEKITSFDGFVKSIFSRPVCTPEWYWQEEWICPDAENLFIYMKKLYSFPDVVLNSYSDSQIEQGIQFMNSAAISDCHRLLCLPTANLIDRVEVIESFKIFFEKIYLIKCTNVSTFLGDAEINPLNNSCFMWWDISPLIASNENEIIDACLRVMRDCLYMPNLACQESALHGLGHLRDYPEWEQECKNIILDFMQSDNANLPVLKGYAHAALIGEVQ